MHEIAARCAKRPWFRLQFSLASVFVLTTLVAVAAWYWYQRPFVVETTSANGDRTVDTMRRIGLSKTLRQGPSRTLDSQGRLIFSTNYRAGLPHGELIRYSQPGDKKEELITYANGLREGPSRSWNDQGELLDEIHYRGGVMHGPIDARYRDGRPLLRGQYEEGKPTGQWTWFPAGGTIDGTWREALPDGHWEWRDGSDRVYATIDFDRGKVLRHDGSVPKEFAARILTDAAAKPGTIVWMFGAVDLDFQQTTLHKVLISASQKSHVPVAMNFHPLNAAAISAGRKITFQAKDMPFVVAMSELVAPLKMGLDYRYGVVYIDTLESIAVWEDSTGVFELSPTPNTPLALELDQETQIDFVEMPMQDAFLYFRELHQIPVQLSLASKPNHRSVVPPDTPLTKTLGGITLRDALGVILSELNCKATVQSDTLVIEPQ